MSTALVKPVTTRVRRTSSGAVLPRVDGRLRTSRRFTELIEACTAELGRQLSEVEQMLAKQWAMISLRCEEMQSAVVAGEAVDADEIIRLTSEARRLLAELKAKKSAKSKPAEQSLGEYLARRYGSPGAVPAEASEG